MAFNYPIPRGVRQADDVIADGTQFDFSVPFVLYDPRDVYVFVRPPGASDFSLVDYPADYTVTLAANSATVTFNTPPVAGTLVRRKGVRVPYRSYGVVNNGVVQSAALETELSSSAAVQQELRRDIDSVDDRVLSAETVAAILADAQAVAAETEAARNEIVNLLLPAFPSDAAAEAYAAAHVPVIPLVAGVSYFNTAENRKRYYTGSIWVDDNGSGSIAGYQASFASSVVADGAMNAVPALTALAAVAEEVVRLKNGSYYIGSNFTPTKTLRFSSETKFIVAPGVTVDFSQQQPEIHAPKKQRFYFGGDASGSVIGLDEAQAGWFAGDGINANINVRAGLQKWVSSLAAGGVGRIPRGYFTSDGTAAIACSNGQHIIGLGRTASRIMFSGTETRGFEFSGAGPIRGSGIEHVGFERRLPYTAPTAGRCVSFVNSEYNFANFVYASNCYIPIATESLATTITNVFLQDSRQNGILVANCNECQGTNGVIAANSSWATLSGVAGTFQYDEVINVAGGAQGRIYPDGNGNYKVIFDASPTPSVYPVAINGATSGATASLTSVIDGHQDGGIKLHQRCHAAVFFGEEVSGGLYALNIAGLSSSFTDKSMSGKFTNCFFDSVKTGAVAIGYAVDMVFTGCWFSSFAPCNQDVYLDGTASIRFIGCQWTYSNKSAIAVAGNAIITIIDDFTIGDTNASNTAGVAAIKFDAGASGTVTNGYIGVNFGAGPNHPDIGVSIGLGCEVTLDNVDVTACAAKISDGSGGTARILNCRGYRTSNGGLATINTDANGQATIAHGLGGAPVSGFVSFLGSSDWEAQTISMDSSNLTIRVKKSSDNSNVASVTGLGIMWQAKMAAAA
ncbi:MAG TPA: hypothetical protein VGU72_04280 [Beijerinckiaceae bacterium]|jgi:hypothetical protein|nr:hypothetical protein [Beijerinckiaceae bacterium]